MFRWIDTRLRMFPACRTGATSIEYALIAGFLSIVVIGSVFDIGRTVSSFYQGALDGFEAQDASRP